MYGMWSTRELCDKYMEVVLVQSEIDFFQQVRAFSLASNVKNV